MTAEVFDPRALRDAFGAFATGVTVVTASDAAGKPIGFTANSFTSVSLDPPLLLVCLAKSSRNYDSMTSAGRFAINVLSETQKDVSNTFARPVEDRFATVDWRLGRDGCPIFSDVAAWFECSMQDIIEAGDHVIIIGRVTAFENSGLNGLGYARGGYFTPRLAGKAVSLPLREKFVSVRCSNSRARYFWQAMKPCRFRIAPSKAAILRARSPPISNN